MEVRYNFLISIGVDLPSGSELSADELTIIIESRLKATDHGLKDCPVCHIKATHIPPKGLILDKPIIEFEIKDKVEDGDFVCEF